MTDDTVKPCDNAIVRMLDETEPLISRRYRRLRNLVIVQDNRLLCARSYNTAPATEANRSPESAAPIKSVTKSIIALLVGIAIDQKLIRDVDQPLSQLLESKADVLSANPSAAELTLHQLLSMSTGIQWRGGRAGMEPLAGRMMQEDDWIAFALSLPVIASDIGQFQYNSAVSHVLSAIIQQACGQSTAAFAEQHLFKPLQIKDYEWETDRQGISTGGWGLSLAPQSLAKIGDLCLHQGQHKGQPIVSKRWITQMWSPHVEAHSQHAKSQPADFQTARYGYQWWIRGNDTIEIYCAEGAGGQMLCCIPRYNAVIVATNDYTRHQISLWPLIEHHWLPALMQISKT